MAVLAAFLVTACPVRRPTVRRVQRQRLTRVRVEYPGSWSETKIVLPGDLICDEDRRYPRRWGKGCFHFYRHRGDRRIVFERRGRLMAANGTPFGVDITGLTESDAISTLRRNARSAETVVWMRAAGLPDKVLKELRRLDSRSVVLNLSHYSGPMTDLKKLARLGGKLYGLVLRESRVPVLSHLPAMPSLQVLDISNERDFKENMGLIGKFPGLTVLTISGDGLVNIAGMKAIAKLPVLRKLVLPSTLRCPSEPSGLKYFAGSTNLVSLKNVCLTSDDARGLEGASSLKRFYAFEAKRGALGFLTRLAGLRVLQIRRFYRARSEGHAPDFWRFKRLEWLEIPDAKSINLESLAGLETLRRLGLAGSLWTDRRLQSVGRMTSLTELHLTQTGITDSGLRMLKKLRHLSSLWLSDSNVIGHGLRHVNPSTRLKELVLSASRCNDSALPNIARHQELEMLDLLGCRVTSHALRHIRNMRKLRYLGLALTKVESEGMRHLTGLDAVRTIILSDTRVGDQALRYLGGLRHLRRLDLSNTKISGDGVRHLKPMKSLRYLDLSEVVPRGTINNTAALHLSVLENLEYLNLTGGRITNVGMRYLSKLKMLRWLSLPGGEIDDKSLTLLGRMPFLQEIVVHQAEGKITQAGKRAFQTANPSCAVSWD